MRNFILEAQADPAIHRLCRTYEIKVADLCLACTEILEEKQSHARSGGTETLGATLLFTDPLRLEGLLKKLRQATHAQTAIQHRLAVIACAKAHAAQIEVAAPEQRRAGTHSNLLKKSIINNLLVLVLAVGLVVAGILIILFLL